VCIECLLEHVYERVCIGVCVRAWRRDLGCMYVCVIVCVRLARIVYIYIYALYMTVNLVISLPKIWYIHTVYIWFWPTLCMCVRVYLLLPLVTDERGQCPNAHAHKHAYTHP